MKLIEEIEGFLEGADRRVFVAQGPRGVGKTSVVAKIVTQAKPRFDDVLWLRCEPDQASLDVVLELLSAFLEHNDDHGLRGCSREQSENRLEVCADELVAALGRRSYLVVFDDLGLWLDDSGRIDNEPVRHLFARLASSEHRSKCILLVERRLVLDPTGFALPFGAVLERVVMGLPEEYAVELLRQEGLAGLDEIVLRDVVARYGGNPLSLRMFVYLVVREHRSVEDVLAREADELLEDVLEHLGPSASVALEALAVFRRVVPRDALDRLGIHFEPDVEALYDRFLVEIDPQSGGVLLPIDIRRRVLGRLDADRTGALHTAAASVYAARERVVSPQQLLDLEPVLEEVFHRGEADAWSDSASLLVEVGDHLLRLGYVEIAEWHVGRVLPHLEDRALRASCLLLRGRVEDWRSSYDDATKTFEQALAEAGDVDPSIVAEAQYRIGRIFNALSRFDEAERWLQACVATCERAGLGPPKAGALVSLAWGKAQRGADLTTTLGLYEEALQAAQATNDHRHESLVHRQIGFLHWDKLEDQAQARKHYDDALRINGEHHDLKETAAILTELAYLRNEWGDLVGAAADCEKAIEICEAIGNRYTLANAYSNQGRIHEAANEWECALSSHEESVKLYRLTRNESGLALAWLRIGAVRRRTGDFDGATQALNDAESISRRYDLVETLAKIEEERRALKQEVDAAAETFVRAEETPASITYIERQEVHHVGHNISVGGNANINIDSVLVEVTQSIEASTALQPEQRTELTSLVKKLEEQMNALKTAHEAECKEIAAALEKAVAEATKEKPSKKLLGFNADGLKRAADLVSDVAPKLLKTAGKIAAFIVGLG